MIYTKFDHLSFIARTLAVAFVFWICLNWIHEASGVNGYAITDIGTNTITVGVGIMKASMQVPSVEGLTIGMRVPAYPELTKIAQPTYYIVYSLMSILFIWHLCIYFKVGKRIKRAKCKKSGLPQTGVITNYNHIMLNMYVPVVDDKFRPEFIMTKGDIKRWPIGTPCRVWHLGTKDYWVDIVKEKAV